MRRVSLFLALLLVGSQCMVTRVAAQSCCDVNPCVGGCVEDGCDSSGYCRCHCTMSTGVIIGIVLGVLALIVILVYLCRRRYQRRQLYLANLTPAQPIVFQAAVPAAVYSPPQNPPPYASPYASPYAPQYAVPASNPYVPYSGQAFQTGYQGPPPTYAQQPVQYSGQAPPSSSGAQSYTPYEGQSTNQPEGTYAEPGQEGTYAQQPEARRA